MFDVQFARRQMIEQQVRAWEVLDLRVLDALEQVPREEFVPAAYRELAFADTSVPIGHGQAMLAPKVEGRILQALDVQPGDRALEVGTGTRLLRGLHRPAGAQRPHDRPPRGLRRAARARRIGRVGVHNVTAETFDAMHVSPSATRTT